METTEKIVEAYVRYIKGWATIPNLRCEGQFEIDLLAIDPVSLDRYHIETSVSGSQNFSRLTTKAFDPELLKEKVQKAGQRRTLGFFLERKFGVPEVKAELAKYGFVDGEYRNVIVTWDWTPEAAAEAEKAGVTLWSFQEIMREIAATIRHKRSYSPTIRCARSICSCGRWLLPRRRKSLPPLSNRRARRSAIVKMERHHSGFTATGSITAPGFIERRAAIAGSAQAPRARPAI